MAIFQNNNGKLVDISEIPIKFEKDIQSMVETNMTPIFGLDFVTKEFELNGLRIDSLGFDNQSQSFVIIEYKREKNFSVIDQGFAYLALLLNNKAEFILEYNERLNKSIKKNDVDWSQSRVIFVSPSFTTYQIQAMGFRDLPIELWEVKQYSNKTILFNQIQTPEKNESITKISTKNEHVRLVSQEIKTYTEEFHLESVPDNIKSLYREIRDAILTTGDNIKIKPTAKYIAFLRKTNFADITVLKSSLKIFLNAQKGTINDPRSLARDVSSIGHWGNGDYEITIKESVDIGYLMSLIRQSFEINKI